MNGIALEPFAGLAYVHLSTNGLTETGSTSALSVSTGDMDTLFSSLGLLVGSSLATTPSSAPGSTIASTPMRSSPPPTADSSPPASRTTPSKAC